MKKSLKGKFKLGLFAIALTLTLVPSLTRAEGPGAGSLLRCFGDSTAVGPKEDGTIEMVRGDLYNDQNQKVGTVVTTMIGMDVNGPIIKHEMIRNKTPGKTSIPGVLTVIEGDSKRNAIHIFPNEEAITAFPAIAAELTGNKRVMTVSANLPISDEDTEGSMNCATGIEVRCCYLVEVDAEGNPTRFCKCLSCHFFITGCVV